MSYDIVIVGGGISGIYLMHQLIEKHKNLKVVLLESSNRFGGRVYTHHEKVNGNDYLVDLGAGRLGFHHEHIMKLVKKLKLDKDIYPISNKSDYIENGVFTNFDVDLFALVIRPITDSLAQEMMSQKKIDINKYTEKCINFLTRGLGV